MYISQGRPNNTSVIRTNQRASFQVKVHRLNNRILRITQRVIPTISQNAYEIFDQKINFHFMDIILSPIASVFVLTDDYYVF